MAHRVLQQVAEQPPQQPRIGLDGRDLAALGAEIGAVRGAFLGQQADEIDGSSFIS